MYFDIDINLIAHHIHSCSLFYTMKHCDWIIYQAWYTTLSYYLISSVLHLSHDETKTIRKFNVSVLKNCSVSCSAIIREASSCSRWRQIQRPIADFIQRVGDLETLYKQTRYLHQIPSIRAQGTPRKRKENKNTWKRRFSKSICLSLRWHEQGFLGSAQIEVLEL